MRQKRRNFMKDYSILFVLLAEIIIFSLMSSQFFTMGNLSNVLRQVSFTMIAALGEALVLLTAGMDLSIGAQITFVNVVTAYMMVKMGFSPMLAALLGITLTTLIGFLIGFIITKTNIPPMIATLAMMGILQGIAYIVSEGRSIYGFPKSFSVIGQGKIGGILPIPVMIMVVCLILVWLLMNKTYVGRYFFAIGGNEKAAVLSGIHVNRYKSVVYTISGFFAGLAGILLLSRLSSGTPLTGDGYEIDIITAVVLGGVSISGGRARISNIVTGVLIIGVLENGLVLVGVGEYPQMVVKGMILLASVIFDCTQRNKLDVSS